MRYELSPNFMRSYDAKFNFLWTLPSPVADLDILQYFTCFSIPFIFPPQCFHGDGNQALDHRGESQEIPSLCEWRIRGSGHATKRTWIKFLVLWIILALFLEFPALGNFLSSTYCQTCFLPILQERMTFDTVVPNMCHAFVTVKQLRRSWSW